MRSFLSMLLKNTVLISLYNQLFCLSAIYSTFHQRRRVATTPAATWFPRHFVPTALRHFLLMRRLRQQQIHLFHFLS